MSILGVSFNKGYLQTWALASRIKRRWKRLGAFLQWACGKTTGHRASKTEWGYGGGGTVDTWCRWCNHLQPMRLDEAAKRYEGLRSAVYGVVGHDVRQGEWTPPEPPAAQHEQPKGE